MRKGYPQPRSEEISKTTTFQRDGLIYISFFVNGSYQVEINGLKIMPGQELREEFASNLAYDGRYDIRFIDYDYAVPLPETIGEATHDILGNPNLKQGTFLAVRLATEPLNY